MTTGNRPEWLDILFKLTKINKHVEVLHNDKFVIIKNDKGGDAEVVLKAQTFKKIAQKLGYVKGE